MTEPRRSEQLQVAATSFMALFSIVGIALYGLPLYYDHMFASSDGREPWSLPATR